MYTRTAPRPCAGGHDFDYPQFVRRRYCHRRHRRHRPLPCPPPPPPPPTEQL